MYLQAFGRRHASHEAHRTVEKDREVNLVLAIGHIDYVQQARRQRGGELCPRPRGAQGGKGNEDKAIEPAFNA
jgi:hypothetical protein